jgi:isocitrate dehydrogenase kinase/phosphatase
LCALDDCQFRVFPTSRSDDDELQAEPWFSVRDGDVFPEELERFLGIDAQLHRVFRRHHGELFEVDFWRTMQARNREGEVIDFFPYAESKSVGSAAAGHVG